MVLRKAFRFTTSSKGDRLLIETRIGYVAAFSAEATLDYSFVTGEAMQSSNSGH
jgi:hypothetical protein